MSGLGAEVRQVHLRHRIRRTDAEYRAGGQRQKPFAGAQNGEGAK
jgi:hypothetical protein